MPIAAESFSSRRPPRLAYLAGVKIELPKFAIILFTDHAGRARHSVRAATGQSTPPAGRRLPAPPVLPSLFVKGIFS